MSRTILFEIQKPEYIVRAIRSDGLKYLEGYVLTNDAAKHAGQVFQLAEFMPFVGVGVFCSEAVNGKVAFESKGMFLPARGDGKWPYEIVWDRSASIS
jgi:hypothetical protein